MKDSKQVRSEYQLFVEAYSQISKNSAEEDNEKKSQMEKGKKCPKCGKNPCECEDDDDQMESVLVRKNNAFTEQAEKYQMSVKQFARFVEANQHLFDIPTRQKAQLANKFQGFRESAEWDQYFGDLQELTTKETKAGTKYKVRVKEKESGSSYIRFATREKISQLRSDPKIASVEMTDQGEAPEEKGEKKAQAAGGGMKKKKLDPVGREDGDVDNDGDKDKSDAYLLKRRAAVGNAIKKRNVRTEGFSNWRDDLNEVIGNDILKKTKRAPKIDSVAQPGVKNKITVNPPMGEEVELVSVEQIDQLDEIAPLVVGGLALGGAALAGAAIKRAQDAARSGQEAAKRGQQIKPGTGIGNAAYGMQRQRDALNAAMKQMNSYEPEGEMIDEAKYGTEEGRKKLAKKVRAGEDVGKKGGGFAKIVKKASKKYGKERATKIAAAAMWKNLASDYQPEGELIDEKKLTEPEMKKREEVVKSMKKKGDFSKYGDRAKEVMYATATKIAKKKA